MIGGGRIRKIATARDLYDHPANRFVAGFIGESNFLDADCQNGRLVLAQAEAPLSGAQADGSVTVMVRPEHLMLGTFATPALTFSATVERLIYFGTDTHVHLLLRGGGRLVSRIQNALSGRTSCAEGDALSVSLPAEALRILARQPRWLQGSGRWRKATTWRGRCACRARSAAFTR